VIGAAKDLGLQKIKTATESIIVNPKPTCRIGRHCKSMKIIIGKPCRGFLPRLTHQNWLAMKLTAFIMTIALLHASGKTVSQQVTLSVKEVNVKTLFAEIKRQTGYVFFYKVPDIEKMKPVTLDWKNTPISSALSELFKDQPLSYTIQGTTVYITPKAGVSNANAFEGQKKDELTAPSPPPPITVQGKIVGETGEPLAGIVVLVKGTSKKTVTDDNGQFSIQAPDANSVLIFSAVNIETKEVRLNGRTQLTLSVAVKVSQLDEVQMIAYGTSSKRINTGSVSTVSSSEIQKQPVANPLNALQGRIAGAIVTQASGLPGAHVTVQIRGQNSLSNGQQPLFIVDGIPFGVQDQSPTNSDLNSFGIYAANNGISPFSLINPSDIEQIDVLKDADATAIYGTKGANGVVLITTKKGKSGKSKFELNVYSGSGAVARFVDMMNTKQYLAMRREAYANDGIVPNATTAPDIFVWDTTQSTNWQKLYSGGTAKLTDAQATISGGDAGTHFLFSSGYHRETTVMPGDNNDSRYSFRFTGDHTSTNKKFNASFSASYSYDKSNLISTDLNTVYNLPPDMPLYNPDGSLFWNNNFTNPESYRLQKYIGNTSSLITNAVFKYQLIKGLELKTNLGFNRLEQDQNQQFPILSKNPNSSPTNSAAFATLDQQAYIIEPQANYSRNIGNGKLTALVGMTFQQSLNKSTSIRADNYSNPGLLGVVSGAGLYTSVSTGYTKYRYNSVFGRFNYNWDSKYILNAVVRSDGSSRFGPGMRFGNFWSVGGAWIFTNESFFKKHNSILSFGKLRGSVGLTGNDQFQDYQYLTLFSSSSGTLSYQGSAVLRPTRVSNPDLHWETNNKVEIGLDLGFLKDRILLTANYYRNRSDNQLGFLRLSNQSGFNSYQANFHALIQNSGLEIELTTNNIQTKNFRWTTSFNLTAPSTKLLQADSTYFSYNKSVLGYPLAVRFAYSYLGVDPATGRPLYKDVTKDSATFVPNVNTDRRVLGYTSPKWYGGINNSFTYKNFDLSFFVQFTVSDGNIRPSSTPGVLSNGNQPTYWLNRWHAPGDISSIPKATTTSSIYSSYSGSDAVWGDASFIRVRNISFSYTLGNNWTKKMKINSCRFFIEAQNVFTWTKNKYVSDPETATNVNQSSVVTPPLRVVTGGINVSF
jgi:TonB-linked SusC/RagA family outer membrane protein